MELIVVKNIMKRVKSFLITATSILGTAFFAVTFMPEWGAFLQLVHDKLASLGIPMAVLAVVGVFISEVWKQILNYRTLAKAEKDGMMGISGFRDVNNELY